MSFNQNEKTTSIIKSLNGENIKKVDDFKYIGSYIGSTEHDISIECEGMGCTKQPKYNMEIKS